MPSAEKVSWAKLRVGITGIVALVLLGLLVFLLTGNHSLFQQYTEVYTFMDDSAAMVQGAAVRLNGIEAGKLAKVELSGESTPNRVVRLTLSIENRMISSIPLDSQAAIGAENLLGTKYINIKKGRNPNPVKEHGELRSLDTREFQDLVNAAYPTLQSVQSIVTRLDTIVGLVESGKGSIGKLLVDDELYRRAVNTVAEVEKISAAISDGKGTVGKLLYDEALYNDVRGTVAKLDKIIDDLQAGHGTAGKLLKDDAMYEEIRKTTVELRKMAEDLNTGKGTAGKLLKSDELSTRINNLLAKIDTTIDKVNSGQGTLGQLMVNPQLYESMNGTMKEVNGLMKDFRSNPKKFLTIQLKLF